MYPSIDMTGKKVGRWKVLKVSEHRNKGLYWECVCECGNLGTVKGGALRNGSSLSCGCLAREHIVEAVKTHGNSNSPEYRSYRAMLNRCRSKTDVAYDRYGGNGITVCERWSDFNNFLEDMGRRPEGHSLGRIDNSKGYEPSNCKWSTKSEQNRNRNIQKRNKTGVIGVHYDETNKRYRPQITVDKKTIRLGSFLTLEEAKLVREEAVKRYWKEM